MKTCQLVFHASRLDILMARPRRLWRIIRLRPLVVAGGVAANQGLRERFSVPEMTDVKVIIPPLRLCGDNAGDDCLWEC